MGEWLVPFSMVVGVNEALRLAAWLTAGGGGGMVGGVDLGWVLTSAGESGIVPTFCSVLPPGFVPVTLKKQGELEESTLCARRLSSILL